MKTIIFTLTGLVYLNLFAQDNLDLESKGFVIDYNLKVLQAPSTSLVFDINGDVLDDILFYEGKTLYYYEATLTQKFLEKKRWAFDDEIANVKLSVPELPSTNKKFTVFFQNGNSAEKSIADYDSQEKIPLVLENNFNEFTLAWIDSADAGQSLPRIYLLDYNRNGKLDIGVVINHGWDYWDPGEVRFYETSGDNSYNLYHTYVDSGVHLSEWDVNDMDMNGYPELFYVHTIKSKYYAIEYNAIKDSFIHYKMTSDNIYYSTLGIYDYDNDGKKDMITSGFTLYKGPAHKTISPTALNIGYGGRSGGYSTGYGVFDIASGNLDDDPMGELVMGTAGSFQVIPYFDYNQTTGAWEEFLIPNPTNVGLLAPVIFDYDGDGKNDIIISGGGFAVFKNLGNHQFQLAYFDDMVYEPSFLIHTWRTRLAALQGGLLVGVATDYDSLSGIVIKAQYSKIFTWWYDKSTGQWSKLWTSPRFANAECRDLRIADIDNDGKINIVSLHVGYKSYVVDFERTIVTELKEEETLPKEFSLFQNYPNPFNPSTTIKYTLPYDGNVKLTVYNSLGEKVKELVNALQATGYHEINFNAEGLPSGVYFYTLEASSIDGINNFRDVKKLLLVK